VKSASNCCFGCSQIAQKKEAREGVPRAFEVKENYQARASSAENQPAVNHRHLQIAKYLASVALRPQTAKPPAGLARGGFAFVPQDRCRAPFPHTASAGLSKLTVKRVLLHLRPSFASTGTIQSDQGRIAAARPCAS
jgi:hypothetical protein